MFGDYLTVVGGSCFYLALCQIKRNDKDIPCIIFQEFTHPKREKNGIIDILSKMKTFYFKQLK